jgi:hypothetical protein
MRCIGVAAIFVVSCSVAAGADDPVTAHAKSLGVAQCTGAIATVVASAQDDENFGYLDSWSKANPDQSIFGSLQVRKHADTTVLTNITVTPTPRGACDAGYTQIWMVPDKTCASLRESTLKDWNYFAELATVPLYERKDSKTISLALVPNGAGCLIVKTAVMFYDTNSK